MVRKVPAKISTSQVKIVWPKKSSSGRPAAARGSARKATIIAKYQPCTSTKKVKMT